MKKLILAIALVMTTLTFAQDTIKVIIKIGLVVYFELKSVNKRTKKEIKKITIEET